MVSSSVTSALGFNHAVIVLTLFELSQSVFVTLSALLIGYALDPSVDTHQVSANGYIGAVDEAEKNKGNNFLHHMFVCI